MLGSHCKKNEEHNIATELLTFRIQHQRFAYNCHLQMHNNARQTCVINKTFLRSTESNIVAEL